MKIRSDQSKVPFGPDWTRFGAFWTPIFAFRPPCFRALQNGRKITLTRTGRGQGIKNGPNRGPRTPLLLFSLFNSTIFPGTYFKDPLGGVRGGSPRRPPPEPGYPAKLPAIQRAQLRRGTRTHQSCSFLLIGVISGLIQTKKGL